MSKKTLCHETVSSGMSNDNNKWITLFSTEYEGSCTTSSHWYLALILSSNQAAIFVAIIFLQTVPFPSALLTK